MNNTEHQGQNKHILNNESEELYKVFTEATLVSDAGIEIEDSKLKKIMQSLCKSKNLKRTRALLKALINDLSPTLFNKAQPIVSVPLTYSSAPVDEVIENKI